MIWARDRHASMTRPTTAQRSITARGNMQTMEITICHLKKARAAILEDDPR